MLTVYIARRTALTTMPRAPRGDARAPRGGDGAGGGRRAPEAPPQGGSSDATAGVAADDAGSDVASASHLAQSNRLAKGALVFFAVASVAMIAVLSSKAVAVRMNKDAASTAARATEMARVQLDVDECPAPPPVDHADPSYADAFGAATARMRAQRKRRRKSPSDGEGEGVNGGVGGIGGKKKSKLIRDPREQRGKGLRWDAPGPRSEQARRVAMDAAEDVRIAELARAGALGSGGGGGASSGGGRSTIGVYDPWADAAAADGGAAAGAAHGRHPHYRVALVLTWLGPRFPDWFHYTLASVGAPSTAYLFDLLVFHEGSQLPWEHDPSVPPMEIPPNVKLFNLGPGGLAKMYGRRMAMALGFDGDEATTALLQDGFATAFDNQVYLVAEFKPATGLLFADYLRPYTHWSYTDADIIFGDITGWTYADELVDTDIVTWTIGDSHRIYVRGTFTVHANTDRVNYLFMKCDYLSDGLFDNLASKADAACAESRYPCFQSAEGCYSTAAVSEPGIRMKFVPKAVGDFELGSQAYFVDGVVFICEPVPRIGVDVHSRNLKQYVDAVRQHPYLVGDCEKTLALAVQMRSARDTLRADSSTLPGRQVEVGKRVAVTPWMPPDVPQLSKRQVKEVERRCDAHWVFHEHRVCIEELSEGGVLHKWEDVTAVSLRNGGYTAVRMRNEDAPDNAVHGAVVADSESPASVRVYEAGIFHFQIWKNFYKFSARGRRDRGGVGALTAPADGSPCVFNASGVFSIDASTLRLAA